MIIAAIRTALLSLISAASVLAAAGNRIDAFGWTITADPNRHKLAISHRLLGTVLEKTTIRLPGGSGAGASPTWTVGSDGASRLKVRTSHPQSSWTFEATQNALRISVTGGQGVLSGIAPAPRSRIVARLLEPAGTPVDWFGTDEVKNSFGGSETHHPSFLPRRNPEVMYFTLGPVSGSGLHALFDRPTDTAIRFPEESRMRRQAGDEDKLQVEIPVAASAVIELIPDYFTSALGLARYVPFDDTVFPRAPMVWSSWTSYYDEVREQDMVRNTDWIAANLKPYGFEYIELDGGYDGPSVKVQHYWIERWDQNTFPHGPKWLTEYIRSKGLRAGMWLVPNTYAGAVDTHPEWYVRNRNGELTRDYGSPVLDSTNPHAMAFVRHMFETLDDWGFEYYKFDGEYAVPRYVPAVDRRKLHDPSADLLTSYHDRLRMIRRTVGPRVFIEGCPAGTPLNGIGYFNSYFNGQDLYSNWHGMYPLFSSINGNAFLNHLAVYVMPGEGLELGSPMSVEEARKQRPRAVIDTIATREFPLTGIGVTDAEARTLVTYIALTGVAYPLASIMPELPEKRVSLLKATMPTLPIFPADLFSRGTDMRWDTFKHTTSDSYKPNYPEILDLKVNASAGAYDVAAFTNWTSESSERTINLADKLGLDAAQPLVAFDYWNQKIIGVYRDRMSILIEPHDTRVILLHPLENRPQLVGLSRHISGTYSVDKLSWDNDGNNFSGIARAIPGEPYTLWIHVPESYEFERATAGGSSVAGAESLEQGALKITFPGRDNPVPWTIRFRRRG